MTHRINVPSSGTEIRLRMSAEKGFRLCRCSSPGSAPRKDFRAGKAYVFMGSGADYATFISLAIPPSERAHLSHSQWNIAKTQCRRAYRAIRSIQDRKDYVSAARSMVPTFKHRNSTPPTLLRILNNIDLEIYDPGSVTIDDTSFPC